MQFKQIVDEVLAEPPPTVLPNQEPPAIHLNLPSTFKGYHKQQVNSQQPGPIGADFVNYLMSVENSIRKGYQGGKWYPHASVEGGAPTIAYGHKIKRGENFNAGITDTYAMQLLIKDIKQSEAVASRLIDSEFGAGTWSRLTTNQKEMFTDFAFNGVLDKFPKFREAVIANDINGMKAHYKRFSKGKELTGRNNEFYKRYLSY